MQRSKSLHRAYAHVGVAPPSLSGPIWVQENLGERAVARRRGLSGGRVLLQLRGRWSTPVHTKVYIEREYLEDIKACFFGR